MYSKCGILEDAKKVFKEIAMPDVVSWNALLSSMASNGCVLSALFAFVDMRMKRLSPFDLAFYILLADLYDESGKPDLAQKTQDLMRAKGLSKKLSKSTVKVQGKNHAFVSEDVTTVEKTNEIYGGIESI